MKTIKIGINNKLVSIKENSWNENQLGYYLAGLIEGDGSIIVPETTRNEKGKLLPFHSSKIQILINSENIPYSFQTGKLNKRFKSTYLNPKGKFNCLHPYYVTGFTDGEASFVILVLKRALYKTGWNIVPVFTISLNSRDRVLLEKIQSFFGGIGNITIRKKDNSVYFTVKSVKDIVNVIIPHFDKYPLLTEKQADFELFKQIVIMMHNKQHLNTKGLNKILSLKASLNRGLTALLTKHFPNIDPIKRPVRKNLFKNLDPNWVTGFVEAEGCFFINTIKSEIYKTGYQIKLNFSIVQHIRDKILMESFVNYFNSGAVYVETQHVTYLITKFSDIQDKIIPFFQKHPLQGYKFSDYNKFCRVGELMKNKAHLTKQGIEEIIKIKK